METRNESNEGAQPLSSQNAADAPLATVAALDAATFGALHPGEAIPAASENMTRNLDRIQKGTMMIGAGLAALAIPAALIASTAASQKALGELASLGVRDLRAIENAAESFTNQWAGTSKAEFIVATYDVKSALSGLSDEAVGVFTSMAALTAKATKASTQEMVGTFTSGYGIFKPIMTDMTDMEWATAFSGAMGKNVTPEHFRGGRLRPYRNMLQEMVRHLHCLLDELHTSPSIRMMSLDVVGSTP